MELTQAQINEFQQNGFLLLKSFVSPEQCDEIKSIAQRHLDERIDPIETEYEYDIKTKDDRKVVTDGKELQTQEQPTIRRLRQVYHRDEKFKEWMRDANLRPILKQILGDNPTITIAHHNSIMTKMPNKSTQTMWHQDFRYWNFQTDNLVSVWLALDEEYSENGVLEFIPGSHKMHFDAEQFDDKEYFREDTEQNQKLIATKTSHSLHKGDVVLFHCKLLHRANKNLTNEPKISFVYTVRGSKNLPVENTRSTAYPEIELD